MADETKVKRQLFNYIADNKISDALILINSRNDIYKAGYKCGDSNELYDSLIYSIIFNKREIALALINKHIYLDSYGYGDQTALHYACKYQQLDIAHALIENGANVNLVDSDKFTPLYWICIYNNVDLAIAMIEKGANV
ncbi:MAG: hypothetical protein Faunusvirus39_9, partial [Faunusvirus sp.]